MDLKNYQRRTLDVVKAYFERVQFKSAQEAYEETTADGDIRLRLGREYGYRIPRGLEGSPAVCIKVPTGGGKTILAAHSLKLIASALSRDYPLVVWFAPSDTIRRQTAEALKDVRHPYRLELDAEFSGHVRVFDLDEKFQILPEDIANNLCIVVATTQAFVKVATEKYNVYRHNENLEPHFAGIGLEQGMEVQDGNPARPKYSFANLVAHHRPIIIVDEAHHMVTDLSQQALARLMPAAILGLTATPDGDNNVLYSVFAQELFDEEMVKLPIELTEFKEDWEKAVAAALAKRTALATRAAAENAAGTGGYLRPIVLFQATPKNGKVPVEKLKTHLVDVLKIPESEIRIATGEQKELDDVDVADPKCGVNYVITVQALKEGWDCPFAYVFCSLVHVGSSKETIQLLGRVMRMPYAKRRKTRELNRAYAFVMSDEFGRAASTLTEGLQARGFAENEAVSAIQQELPQAEGWGELFETPPDVVRLSKDELDEIVLPDEFAKRDFADGSGEITLSGKESEVAINALVKQLSAKGHQETAQMLKVKHRRRKEECEKPVPARTKTWRFPRLAVNAEGIDLFSTDMAYEVLGEPIAKFLPLQLNPGEISFEEKDGRTFVLKLDGNQMTSSFSNDSNLGYLKGFSGDVEMSDVVNVLDGMMTDCSMLSQADRRHWLSSVVADLHRSQGVECERLLLIRYQLRSLLEKHYFEAVSRAKCLAYQKTFNFETPFKLGLDLPGGFTFDETLYEGNTRVYRGSWRFAKHYLGPRAVPEFDGRKPFGEGEEFECAKLIDASDKVVCWLRNKDSDARSFRLPMGGMTDWFYPDFIGELADGRLFVLEYKGKLTGQSEDAIEKDAVGKLWAAQDPKNYVYATVYGESKDGLSVERQIERAFRVEASNG
ncbi:MAG: DEAD/DEAH box helicase family protein [Kiritimatiellae bacterium]|nr:DEAD/DEAH box helicase family protein [Kiritimatiellia bacterium]